VKNPSIRSASKKAHRARGRHPGFVPAQRSPEVIRAKLVN
jgi:hypothetical protein